MQRYTIHQIIPALASGRVVVAKTDVVAFANEQKERKFQPFVTTWRRQYKERKAMSPHVLFLLRRGGFVGPLGCRAVVLSNLWRTFAAIAFGDGKSSGYKRRTLM
jgi:hypothetical protein